jgi:competence protein ComEC
MKKIISTHYLISISIGFFVGIFVASFLKFSWLILLIALAVFILILFSFWQDLEIRLMIFGALSIVIGIFYYHFFVTLNVNQLPKYYSKNVVLQGQIISDPDIRQDKIKLAVQIYKIKEKGSANFQNINGKVLINANRFPEYQFGDWLEVNGTLSEPPTFSDFDYKSYLSRYGITSIMSYATIKNIPKPISINQNRFTNYWNDLKKNLFQIKNQFVKKINQLLPEPQASFLAGLLIGAKRAIPQSLMDAFNKTGVTHIVVISGYNITIIIKAFMSLTKKWSKKLSIILAILGVILFTVMVGGESTVLRATLMALFIIWAERIGRKSDITIVLIMTALIMVLLNPKIIRFDLGFQLSFFAVIGLIYFSPILENLFLKLNYKKYLPDIIKEPLFATLSAQVFVIPIILYNFHRISIIAPVANVLILSAVPITMFFGFIAVIISFIWFGFGQIVAWITWVFLTYMIWVAMGLSKLPMASVENITVSWIPLLIWYTILILFIIWYYKKNLKMEEVIGE